MTLDHRSDEYRQRLENPPEDMKGPAGDWMSLLQKGLVAHVREQVERIMPALTLIQGTATVRDVDDYVQDILVAISALRVHRDTNATANCGGIVVIRSYEGDNENYEIALVASKVYGWQVLMEQRIAERAQPHQSHALIPPDEEIH